MKKFIQIDINNANFWKYFSGLQYSCLGSWSKNGSQYIAIANLKESRMEEKYRCMIKKKADQYYIGMSLTPQCNQLTTPEDSPIRIKLSPRKY